MSSTAPQDKPEFVIRLGAELRVTSVQTEKHADDPALTAEAPQRRIGLCGLSGGLKVCVVFILGLLSLLLMFVLGAVFLESGRIGEFGVACAFSVGMGACFLISQDFLSRGKPQALRTVWPSIIAMTFVALCAAIIRLVVETKGAALGMLLVTTITLACSDAGGALAARTARE